MLRNSFIGLLAEDQTTSYLNEVHGNLSTGKIFLNKPQAIAVVLVGGSHLSEIPMKKIVSVRCSFLTDGQGLVRLELYLKDLARSPQRPAFPMPI